MGDALKIQVSAAPERGKANAAVEQLLAKALGAPVKDVAVTSGLTSPRKTILVAKISMEMAAEKLGLKP